MCELKKCTSCFEDKGLDEYTNKKNGKFGKHAQCKLCLKNKIKVPVKIIEKGKIFCNSCKTTVNVEDSYSSSKCKICQKIYYNDLKSREKILPANKIKTCAECKIEYSIDNFHKNSYNKDGLNRLCKNCNQEKTSKYVDENPEKVKKARKIYSEINSEKLKAKRKIYYENNKERILIVNNLYRINNPESYKGANRKCYIKRLEEGKIKDYDKTRSENDPIYKLKKTFYRKINKVFKGFKSKKTQEILGCTIEEFKAHIESQFLYWMNWENYGNCKNDEYNCSWHLDHIIPLNCAKTEQELYLLNHWSNFQPLCGKLNRDKWNQVYPLSNLEIGVFIDKEKKLKTK